VVLSGKYTNNEYFCSGGKIIHCDGTLSQRDNEIILSDMTSAIIIFKILPPQSDISHTSIQDNLLTQLHISLNFDTTFDTHRRLHQDLFNRVSFSITQKKEAHDTAHIENLESMLLTSYNGKIPLQMYEIMFYYGRFLLICSSRPNGWPANLQGVWNGNYYPAWSSDYHNDENIQMNYWAALPGNLAEMTLPYFDFYNACIPDCQQNAHALFGGKGIFIPIAQTIKGRASLYGGAWLNWTAGAGWIAQLYYDYWLYTRDEHFLRDQAIPYLKQIAAFYETFLFKGQNGKYIFCPSLSPENTPAIPNTSIVTINATMDIAIAKEVLHNLCDGCSALGIDSENIPKWQQMIADLPVYEINDDGAMKEWLWPGLKDNYEHRHFSHLYGVFPGFEITDTFMPEIFNACKVAVEKRQVIGQMSQTGWSLAHMANLYARLHDGERALSALNQLFRSCVGNNLFTYHNDWRHQGLTLYWNFMDRIFQIDANFGITAAILEMVLYSNQILISILPAIPSIWSNGEITGILARGAISLDIKWEKHPNHGKIIHLRLQTEYTQNRVLKFASEILSISIESGEGTFEVSPNGNMYRNIALIGKKPLSFIIHLKE
jgi:alpha-L-fucosidase 2